MGIAANALALLALMVLGFADAIYVKGMTDPALRLGGEEPTGLAITLLAALTAIGFAAVVAPRDSTRVKLAIATAIGCLSLELFPLTSLWFLLLPAGALAGGSAVLRTVR